MLVIWKITCNSTVLLYSWSCKTNLLFNALKLLLTTYLNVTEQLEKRTWLWFFFLQKTRPLCIARLLTLLVSGDVAKKKSESSALLWSFRHFLQCKSDESTKHYLTQMLLVINWRYWHAGENSRMRMKFQGRLMQVRLIEINQFFAENK